MVQDSTSYGVQYKDGALRETPLAAVFSQSVTSTAWILLWKNSQITQINIGLDFEKSKEYGKWIFLIYGTFFSQGKEKIMGKSSIRWSKDSTNRMKYKFGNYTEFSLHLFMYFQLF